MKSFKSEGYKEIGETVQEIFGENDPILLQFDVLPLDYKVKDILSPKFFVSRSKLALVVDDVIEVYNIMEIAVWILGGKPNFTLTQQALEYRPEYTSSKTPLSKNTDIPDDFVRLAFMERNSLQKEFVLRKGKFPVKGYQTWAFAYFLKNLQKGRDDYKVNKMVHGDFSFFDGYFLTIAFLIFVAYVLISVLLGWILPDIVARLLDSLFALFCLVVLGWTFWTIFVNIRNYSKVYESYRIMELKKAVVKNN